MPFVVHNKLQHIANGVLKIVVFNFVLLKVKCTFFDTLFQKKKVCNKKTALQTGISEH